jgi:AP-1 complex subunit gamma-1
LKLREVIKQIRQCKTAAEERAVISKESALIRNAIKEKDPEHMARNIAKLIFFNLLGYQVQFGQVECLKLVASSDFTEKRIGYLGLSQLLSEGNDILMMVTNSIKKDLNDKNNNFVVALGLTAIAEISTEEMCRELYPEVKNIMRTHKSNFVKQKAIMAAIRILKIIPDAIDDFSDTLDHLIFEKHHHTLLMCTVTLVQEILVVDPSHIKKFRRYVEPLVKSLKGFLMGGY